MLTPEIRINTSTFRREGFSKQGIKNMSRRYIKNMMLFLILGVVCTTVYIVTLNREQPVSGGSKQKVHNMKIQDDLLENDDHEDKNVLGKVYKIRLFQFVCEVTVSLTMLVMLQLFIVFLVMLTYFKTKSNTRLESRTPDIALHSRQAARGKGLAYSA